MTKLMMIEEYAFSAAHYLPGFPEGHRDRGVHGHTWTVEVHLEVEVGSGTCAFDHAKIDALVGEVLDRLDHKLINDLGPGLESGLNEDIVKSIGFSLSLVLGRGLPAATLTKVVLGQLSAGSSRRLVCHKTVWEPDEDSHALVLTALAELFG